MEEKLFDCIILGGGPAGMSAALYAQRGNLKTAIIDSSALGGQPVNYLEIENYLGFPSIKGFELSDKFEEHIDKFKVEKFTNEEIQSVKLNGEIKTVTTLNKIFKAKSVIIATGAKPQKLNIKGEEEYKGKGVSYCAVCDGAFYKDKIAVVVGGGNSALEEAIYLTRFAKKVFILHRRDEFRADRIIQARVFSNEKIEFVFDAVPVEILGENGKATKVLCKNTKTNQTFEIITDAIFPYIGFLPNSKLFAGEILMDEKGFILTDEKMKTNIEGVFAAGDVRKTPLRQVITAVSDGAISGVFAVKYIEEKETLMKEKSMRI